MTPGRAPVAQPAVRRADFSALLALAAGEPDAGRAPLFCVHPAAGVGWEYATLAPHLGPGRALYTLQAPALGDAAQLDDAALPASVEDAAADYLQRVRAVQPQGPYCLLGWSYGGAVAHAMATRLRAAGEPVGLLAILDWYPYDPARPQDEPSEHDYLMTLLENLGCTREHIEAVAGSPVAPDGARRVLLGRGHVLDFLDDARLEAILRVFLHHAALGAAHRPAVFDGPLLFFRAAAEPLAGPPAAARTAAAWRPYAAGPIESADVEIEHRRMLQREPAGRIGGRLAEALAAADRETGARR